MHPVPKPDRELLGCLAPVGRGHAPLFADVLVREVNQLQQGRNAHDLCRELGVGTAAFYKWRQRYGGLEVKEPEEENARLKKVFAELSLAHHALKEAVDDKR